MTMMSSEEARELVNQRKKDTIPYIVYQIKSIKEKFNEKIERAISDYESHVEYCIYHRKVDIVEVDTFNNFISELVDLNYNVESDTVVNFKTTIKIFW